MDDKLLLEELARLSHEQWSHFMNYLFDEDFGEICGKSGKWMNQCVTDYKDLSEEEKEKDRVWARKVVEVIAQEILKHKDCTVMHNLGAHGKGPMTCLDKVLESLGHIKEGENES